MRSDHRDTKPSNLLLDIQGNVWIADFGLAKAEGSGKLTGSGDILGTLAYMAPERFRAWSDPRSDIYGLGLILYEMLTLQPAFQDESRERLIRRVNEESPIPPRRIDPEIPRDLETLVLKCIEKEPGQRYQTAQDLRDALEAIRAGAATTWAAWRYRFARRRWLLPAGTVIVVAALLFGPRRVARCR